MMNVPSRENSAEDSCDEFELGVPIPGKILARERWTQTAIKKLPEKGPLDFDEIFSSSQPIVVEIGCGNGRFILSSAIRRPHCNHVGIDILPVVIRYATRRANQRGLQNVRFAVCDGMRFLQDYVSDWRLHEIHIYHPQPVHQGDRRDIGHRLISPEFLGLAFRKLRVGGEFFVQTDSLPYWEYMACTLPRLFDFHELRTPWPEDPWGRSRREIIARQRKLKIYRGLGTKASELPVNELEDLVKQMELPRFKSDRKRRRK